ELGSIRFLSKEENIQTLNSSFNVMLANENTLVKNNAMNKTSRGALFIAAETIVQFLRERGQLYRNPNLQKILDNEFLIEEKIN
ncbi:MAG: hypothetical protein SH817_03805, partial [Leptospira sp.]|nr:hypothetical protein [Leptospira sp.]